MNYMMIWGRALLLAGVSIPLAACTNTAHEAYKDAKVQIGYQKAGFEPRRDAEALLAFAAVNATTTKDIIRHNREYAKYELDRRKYQKAYSAYERAALAGDNSSARKLVKGHYDGLYQPTNVVLVARDVYLPLTADKSDINTRLLLAKLLDIGEISGREFKTSSEWLREAGERGSSRAFRELAERAEKADDVAQASDLYARSETTSKAERALRQARSHYLGQEGRPNVKLGHAWMELARKLDRKRAAQLAARIHRTTSGQRDGAYLTDVAAAAGVNVLGQGQLLQAYNAAKTDEERGKIIAPLRAAAGKGDANASYTLAMLFINTGDKSGETADLLAKAYAGGRAEALDQIIAQVLRAEAGQKSADELYSTVEKAAEKGNVDAARALSSIYRIGGFKPADKLASRKWLRLAADSGDVKSQYELGVDLYENGGDGQSKELALKYLKMAAQQGDAFAQSYLSSTN